jgi:hypothetical protein
MLTVRDIAAYESMPEQEVRRAIGRRNNARLALRAALAAYDKAVQP